MTKTRLGGSSKRKFFASCVCCEPAPARAAIPLDRRNFLSGGLAALGLGAAAGTIGAPAVKAQAAKTRIDVHHHFLPPVHREALDQAQAGRAEMVAADVARRDGQERHRDLRAVAGPARHLVRRRGGVAFAEPRHQRIRREARAGASGPLRPVRDHHAARRRGQPQGNRICLRHAEVRRLGNAHEL